MISLAAAQAAQQHNDGRARPANELLERSRDCGKRRRFSPLALGTTKTDLVALVLGRADEVIQ